MSQQFIFFWYQFHHYIHDSWMRCIGIPKLNSNSSSLRLNLAYSCMCDALEIDKALPQYQTSLDTGFLYRLIQNPVRYIELAGVCLSTKPKFDFLDAALMSEEDLRFAVQTCNALSLNQRFACQSDSPPSPYESGLLLLHAYLLGVDPWLWQRVKLCTDAEVEQHLGSPDGSFDLHQSVLKRLWKTIDLFIKFPMEESPIAA